MGYRVTETEETVVEKQRHLPKPSLLPTHLKSISTYRILNFPASFTVQNFSSSLFPPVQHKRFKNMSISITGCQNQTIKRELW